LGLPACCACPPRAESLTCRSSSHLLLWFESNDSQRHLRVAPILSDGTLLHAARLELRASLRALRRSVPAHQRAAAAAHVARHVEHAFPLRAHARVALYAPLDEELDTAPLYELARRRGCEIYLPRIEDFRAARMSFRLASGALIRNRFGILEPDSSRRLAARWFDLVFVPLVAFDARCTRLGMGAGFYDRAFAWRNARDSWDGPRLVGLAYALQQVPLIPEGTHDVRLDAVVTEQGVIRCSTG
jgi:5-formyltetrahydrofolate cyclo-ligase